MQIPWKKIADPKNPDPSNISILRTQKHPCEKKKGSNPYIPEGPMILRELVDFAVESSDGGRDVTSSIQGATTSLDKDSSRDVCHQG